MTPKSMIQATAVARCQDVCHLNPDSDVGCYGTLSRSYPSPYPRALGLKQAGGSVYGADVTDVEVQRDR